MSRKKTSSNPRKTLSIRPLIRKNLPWGKYTFLVVFDAYFYAIRSKKYNLKESYIRLKPFKSKRERQRVRDYYRREVDHPGHVIALDKLEEDLYNFSIGKTKIDFRCVRNCPLYVYLTDETDLTMLLMKYHQDIFRIYKISTKSNLEQN